MTLDEYRLQVFEKLEACTEAAGARLRPLSPPGPCPGARIWNLKRERMNTEHLSSQPPRPRNSRQALHPNSMTAPVLLLTAHDAVARSQPLAAGPSSALPLRHLRAALRAAIAAVDAELTGDGLREPLAAESLANAMAVHLLRHVPPPQQPARSVRNELPRAKLRAVLEYIEQHLDGSPTLEQMAAVARLSPTYFASQFKHTTGLPPYRYVIGRRIARAKQVLRSGRDLSLAQIALQAGFSDQSQFSRHFKRFIGVTPGEFRRQAIER
jgi:AraC-like DNA-binding protein